MNKKHKNKYKNKVDESRGGNTPANLNDNLNDNLNINDNLSVNNDKEWLYSIDNNKLDNDDNGNSDSNVIDNIDTIDKGCDRGNDGLENTNLGVNQQPFNVVLNSNVDDVKEITDYKHKEFEYDEAYKLKLEMYKGIKDMTEQLNKLIVSREQANIKLDVISENLDTINKVVDDKLFNKNDVLVDTENKLNRISSYVSFSILMLLLFVVCVIHVGKIYSNDMDTARLIQYSMLLLFMYGYSWIILGTDRHIQAYKRIIGRIFNIKRKDKV